MKTWEENATNDHGFDPVLLKKTTSIVLLEPDCMARIEVFLSLNDIGDIQQINNNKVDRQNFE